MHLKTMTAYPVYGGKRKTNVRVYVNTNNESERTKHRQKDRLYFRELKKKQIKQSVKQSVRKTFY